MFRTEALRQRIELINHLIEFGRQLILIQGATGFGKTTMLDAIEESAEPGWIVIRFNAGPTLNGESLLEKISASLDFEPTERFSEEEVCSEIHRRLEILDKSNQIVIVAIDDAHELPAATHSLLLRLAHNDEATAEIRVVLAADSSDASLLDHLQTSAAQQALIHTVDIPKMDLEQTASLLSWWQDQQQETPGLTQDEKFSRPTIDEIYENSGGIPGNIIILARQYLLRGANTQLRADPVKKYIVIGVIAFLAVAVFGFFGKDVAEHTEQELDIELPESVAEIETPSLQVPPPSPVKPLPNPVKDEEHLDAPKPSQPANNLNLKLQASPQTEKLDPISSSAKLDDMLTTALLEGVLADNAPGLESTEKATDTPPAPAAPEAPAQPIAQPPQSEVKPSLKTATENKPTPEKPAVIVKIRTPPPAPVVVEAPKAAPPEVKNKRENSEKSGYSLAKLFRESPQGYVLQLFGVRNHDAAIRYVNKHSIKANSAVVASLHEGAPWYVVVYGQYSSRQAATAAAGTLSQKLPNVKPWPRPISSLK